jgi:hypothetical protein
MPPLVALLATKGNTTPKIFPRPRELVPPAKRESMPICWARVLVCCAQQGLRCPTMVVRIYMMNSLIVKVVEYLNLAHLKDILKSATFV